MSSLSRSIERAAVKKKNKKAEGEGGDYDILTKMLVFLLVFLTGSGITFVFSAYFEGKLNELSMVLLFWGGIIVSIVFGVGCAVTMKKPPAVASQKYKGPKEKSSWVQVRKQKV